MNLPAFARALPESARSAPGPGRGHGAELCSSFPGTFPTSPFCFYLAAGAGHDPDLHLRERPTVRHSSRRHRRYRRLRTGRAKLVWSRQISRAAVWSSIVSGRRRSHVFVNGLSDAGGRETTFYRFSGSTVPVCMHGSSVSPLGLLKVAPFPLSRPSSPSS